MYLFDSLVKPEMYRYIDQVHREPKEHAALNILKAQWSNVLIWPRSFSTVKQELHTSEDLKLKNRHGNYPSYVGSTLAETRATILRKRQCLRNKEKL